MTFKSIVIDYFKAHGIESPSIYLSERAGISRTQIYWLFNATELGVGIKDGQLDPKYACFFMHQADEVVKEEEMFEPTPIDNYLRPLLEKFYQEIKKNDRKR